MTLRLHYCGSTVAFGACRFAGHEHPVCGATGDVWGACIYRNKRHGVPDVPDDIVVAHGEFETRETKT